MKGVKMRESSSDAPRTVTRGDCSIAFTALMNTIIRMYISSRNPVQVYVIHIQKGIHGMPFTIY